MKELLTALFCVIVFVARGKGDDNAYAVKGIPDGLLKNANVVKRMEVVRFEINGKNRARLFQKVAFTILNEQGDYWAYFSRGYDKLRSIQSFDGVLYDASGKKIKNLRKADIRDESATDEGTLADDSRIKWHNFFYKVYPYTVEYETEIQFRGTLFLPNWIPQEKAMMSVEDASITVVCPSSNALNYQMFNYKNGPVISTEKSSQTYTWQVSNIPAVEPEYAAPSWHEITTSVFFASEKFGLEDYEGSNKTWEDFGKFVYDLKKDRDALPDNVKQKVHELTDGLADNKSKITALYEYMQDNTRYISVQLGIGGWQPFDAKYVATRKYGDCKALSNFMYALLKEAGIRSVYTIITAGDDDDYLLTGLPCSQFNHVILFVPGDNKDTTWLECTSQTKAAGYLGNSTSNRYALAVDEKGGSLVRTPRYGVNENQQVRNIAATIDEKGNLSALVKTNYKAVQQDRLHAMTNGLSKDKLMEFLKEDIELPTYDIRNFAYKEQKDILPVIAETLDLVSENYAAASGKRLFIAPNIMTRAHQQLNANENRKYELVIDFEFRDVDSTAISIPAGYTAEAIPKDVKMENKFGKYIASTRMIGNKIMYYRSYEQFSGRYPASDYQELVIFYDIVYKADRMKVVLVKTVN